jgi:hypothetical protein
MSEEDLLLGTELLVGLTYCPDHVVEAAKLALFNKNLIQSQDAKTIFQATMNNLKPGVLQSKEILDGVEQFYQELGRKQNFSLGTILAALSSPDQLRNLLTQDSPFITSQATDIRSCLEGGHCHKLMDTIGNGLSICQRNIWMTPISLACPFTDLFCFLQLALRIFTT